MPIGLRSITNSAGHRQNISARLDRNSRAVYGNQQLAKPISRQHMASSGEDSKPGTKQLFDLKYCIIIQRFSSPTHPMQALRQVEEDQIVYPPNRYYNESRSRYLWLVGVLFALVIMGRQMGVAATGFRTTKVEQMVNSVSESQDEPIWEIQANKENKTPKDIDQNIKQLTSNIEHPLLTLTHTQQQLKQIVHDMSFPPERPQHFPQLQKSLQMEDQVYFAYELSKQPNNPAYLQAQWFYYDQKYQIGRLIQELPLCIVMVGRNLHDNYAKMLESISRQNYTNYHGIYVDDQSDDGSWQKVNAFIQELAPLKQKIHTYQQSQRKYALYNRNYAIRNYCHTGDIILDVDADDWLIGNQVFKLINTLYQDNQSKWAIYFNNIIYYKGCKCPLPNSDKTFNTDLLKDYRTANVWRTTELRTFLYDLYIKIDDGQFVDPATKQFYRWKSDSFMQFALVQLAGAERIMFVDEFVYFYDDSFKKPSAERNRDRLIAKSITPYEPLASLSDTSRKVEGYRVPQSLVDKLKIANEQLHKL